MTEQQWREFQNKLESGCETDGEFEMLQQQRQQAKELSQPAPQTCFLILSGQPQRLVGVDLDIGNINPEEDGTELVEWPLSPLSQLEEVSNCSACEYASEVISTDTADLGKLTSLDTLTQIHLAARAIEGWECYAVLAGQYGASAYPPSVTLMYKRKTGGETP